MKVHLTSFGAARQASASSQDAFATKVWGETVIAVVADGAGGARAGGEASQRAVEAIVSNYAERPRAWSPRKSLSEFTRLVNHRLYQDSLERYGAPELVTTLCVAVIEGDRLFGLNVGDSRVYLSSGGKLEQLSEDHVLEGRGYSHVLSRALGLAPEVEPYFFERAVQDGDLALLCTDGVSNVLDASILGAKLQQRSAARSIVQMTKEQAKPEQVDDTSAVVIDIQQAGHLQAERERPLEIPTRLERGMEVDGFQLERPFQQTDRVWLASREGVRHVLKFAPLEARENEALLNTYVREMWYATRLASPHFPRAFAPEGATARYYAMEFIEAPTLKALLRSRRLGVEEAVALGRAVLAATQDLLRLDLVHGDIKPENILVVSGYDSLEYRVIDFGSIAEVFSTSSRAGTASYLAPERFSGSAISERTEIFAIGVTLYEALTGELPYGEIERYQTPRFHAATVPSALNANLPRWFEAVLLRAIAPEPEHRYQNYSALLFDLEHPEQVEPFHQPKASLLERDPLRFYRTGFFILLAAVIFLLVRLITLSPALR